MSQNTNTPINVASPSREPYEASGYFVQGSGKTQRNVWFVDREVSANEAEGTITIERRIQRLGVLIDTYTIPLEQVLKEQNRPVRSHRHAANTRRNRLKNARAWDPATQSFSKMPKL